MAHPMQHHGERTLAFGDERTSPDPAEMAKKMKKSSEPKVPTPTLEILKHAQGPGGLTGTNLAFRWWVDKEEFGVQTFVPQHETNPSSHYEAMGMQYLINEFVEWVNDRE